MRPHPRYAETNPQSPHAWATCMRCGFVWNLDKLQWQHDWRGNQPQCLNILVCDPCLDKMQRQLGTIVLPPDPVAVRNARPEPYAVDEEMSILEDQTSAISTGFGNILQDQSGNDLFSN